MCDGAQHWSLEAMLGSLSVLKSDIYSIPNEPVHAEVTGLYKRRKRGLQFYGGKKVLLAAISGPRKKEHYPIATNQSVPLKSQLPPFSKIMHVASAHQVPQPQHDHDEILDPSKVSAQDHDHYQDAPLALFSSSAPSSTQLDLSTTHKEATMQHSTISVLHMRSDALGAILLSPFVLDLVLDRVVVGQVVLAEVSPLVLVLVFV